MTRDVVDRSTSGLPEGGKARRVYLQLRDDITRGVHAEGDLLPGEQRLAATLDVSRVTVRRALDVLEGEGLVERRAGAGTMVKRPGPIPGVAADFATLMPQVAQMGDNTTARLLSFSYGAPPAGVAQAMRVAPGTRMQTAVRLRLIEDRAFSHLTTYVPEEIAQNYTEAELATTPLFRLLERSGVEVESADQSVTATLAAPDVAGHLGLSVGAPLLALDRVVRDAQGRGVEYLSALYRPDMFKLEMTLSRVGAGEGRHWEPVIKPSVPEAAA
ncbi:GntR family transcriptional regulator [Sulfitobacter albidus]|uniref:GntR family transcriptional regulator n=1 Tax=Sulfitobacter albidus TaxID=2829501 RepID=A0A975PNY3_9RHOB|nr:GntR family transcriptional regulator [Sulfitobacter albidus]QUJ78303.1 GntR family transcriptional regulator [Sulfitobacter albidus]